MIAMLAVGLYFPTKKTKQPKILRKWTEYEQLAYHLSVVATDVGGVFNWFRGLGFIEFLGSWMLFTGLWRLVECRLPYSKG
jgi:hypothetical protein